LKLIHSEKVDLEETISGNKNLETKIKIPFQIKKIHNTKNLFPKKISGKGGLKCIFIHTSLLSKDIFVFFNKIGCSSMVTGKINTLPFFFLFLSP